MRALYCLTCVLIASTLASGQSTAPVQPQGRIIGSVVNDLNEPIGYATLCTTVAQTNSATTNCGPKTDAEGHFEISVPLETNRVSAGKPEAGYQLQTTRPLEEGVRVRLSVLNPVAHVRIKIGPRPAELILTVRDGGTGKLVDSFVARWIRIDDGPVQQLDSTNKSQVLVPPDVDLLLTVRASGYQRWFYTDPSSPSRPTLRLASGEQKEIAVELEPQ